MANISYIETTKSQLSSIAIKSGQRIICTDTGEEYYDDTHGDRVYIGDNIKNKVEDVSTQLDTKANKNEIDVSDFGAVNDGIVDNHKAFQDAFNYAKNNGFSKVIIPSGEYNFLKTVKLPNGIDLEGIGNVKIINSITNENCTNVVNIERHRCVFLCMAEYDEDSYTATSGEYLMKTPIAVNEFDNSMFDTKTITVPSTFDTVDGRVISQSIPSDLEIGDTIRIVSYNNWIGRSLQGEYRKIKSIEGSSITLDKALSYKVDISEKSPWRKLYETEPDSLGFYTDDGKRPNVLNYPYQGFYKIEPCTNNIKNLEFVTGSISNQVGGRWGILYLGSLDSIIENCKFESNLWLMDSQNVTVANCTFNNVKNWLGNGCCGIKIINPIINNSTLTIEEGAIDTTIISPIATKDIINNYDEPLQFMSKSRDTLIVNPNITSSSDRCLIIYNSCGNFTVLNGKFKSKNSVIFLKNSNTKNMDLNLNIAGNTFEWINGTMISGTKLDDAGDIKGNVQDNIICGNINQVCWFDSGKTYDNLQIINYTFDNSKIVTKKKINLPTKGSYFTGDVINIDGDYFRCITSGNFNRVVNGLTLTISNLSNLATVSDATKLKIGDIINVNGVPGRYKIINICDNKIELFPTPRANVTNGALFLSGSPSFEVI